MLIWDSGPKTATFRVSSASPVKELHPASPTKATPSATRCKKVFTGSSSVVAVSYIAFGFNRNVQQRRTRDQLADEAVPANHAGSTDENHILGLHLELVCEKQSGGRLGIQLEHSSFLLFQVVDAPNHIDFLAAGSDRRNTADLAQHFGKSHAAGAVGEGARAQGLTHDEHPPRVIQTHMHLVTWFEIHLTDAAGRCGQPVVIQAIGLTVPGDGQVGKVGSLGVNACFTNSLQQGQALGVDRYDAGILECAAEIDLLAVVLENVYVNLGLLDIACQASSDYLTQFFQGLAGYMHITDKWVEQSPIVPYHPSVGAGGLLLAAGDGQFRMIPHSDEERVVWPDAVVLGHIIQQRRGHFSLGFDGQILGDQLGRDLHHFHHAVLGGVLADQTISIHMHARREHAGLKEESGNAKGDKRESGHGWHSSILVDIKKAT